MHLINTDIAFQLASDRRQRLLAEMPRRRRLPRRPVVEPLPWSPPDAA